MLDAGCWMQVGTQASCLLAFGICSFPRQAGKMPAFPLASSIQHLTSNIFPERSIETIFCSIIFSSFCIDDCDKLPGSAEGKSYCYIRNITNTGTNCYQAGVFAQTFCH